MELWGVKPFDRMMAIAAETPATQKSTYTAWGANHNFFNTEWQQNDSHGCLGHAPIPQQAAGSSGQQQIALASLVAFFRANVGAAANPTLNRNFNPRHDPPPVVTSVTRVDQGFTPSPSSAVTRVFDDFDPPRGGDPAGISNVTNHSDVTITHGIVPNHDPSLAAGHITWTSPGADRYFQSTWTAAGSGNDVRGYQTLDFRISQRNNPLNPSGATNFSIRLVMADGSVSDPVPLCRYADLRGPVGGYNSYSCVQQDTSGNCIRWADAHHPVLQTVRIPLADFVNADLSRVRGVRLVFDIKPSGAIHLANIRFAP